MNTNPCIEESSELLKGLLRRMLEDMAKLVLDPIFPKPRMRRRRGEKMETKVEVKKKVVKRIVRKRKNRRKLKS